MREDMDQLPGGRRSTWGESVPHISLQRTAPYPVANGLWTV